MTSPDKYRPVIPHYPRADVAPEPTIAERIAKHYIENYKMLGLTPEETRKMEWNDLETIHPEQKKFFEVANSLLHRYKKGERFTTYELLTELRKAGLLLDINTVVISRREMKLFANDKLQPSQSFLEFWMNLKQMASQRAKGLDNLIKTELLHTHGLYGYDRSAKVPFIILADATESEEEDPNPGRSKLTSYLMIAILATLGHELGHKLDDEKNGFPDEVSSDVSEFLKSELRQMHFSLWFLKKLKQNFRQDSEIEDLLQHEDPEVRRLLMEHFAIKSQTGIFSKVRKMLVSL